MKEPVLYPELIAAVANVEVIVPFPFVPAMCTIGYLEQGLSNS